MFKKFAIVLVALFAFGGTVSAYAWWDQLQVQENINAEIELQVNPPIVVLPLPWPN